MNKKDINSVKRDTILNALTDEQLDFVFKIATIVATKRITKGELAELVLPNGSKIEGSYDKDYYGSIQEVYPGISNANLVMDYTTNAPFGDLVNLNDLLIKKILEV